MTMKNEQDSQSPAIPPLPPARGYTASEALTLDSIAATFEADADRIEASGVKGKLYRCALKTAELAAIYRERMKQCNTEVSGGGPLAKP